jgi:uncharacterized phage protein (TIGR02220 family)
MIFYRSFWEAIKNLPECEQIACVRAILEYGFDDKEPEEPGAAKALFMMARPQIDANNARYENGKKGGKPRNNQSVTKVKPKRNQSVTNCEPNRNQTVTKPKPNVNDNENVNDKKDILSCSTSGETSPTYQYAAVIDYLNIKANTHYRATSADTKKHIKARFDEGYTLDDFKSVIDKKTAEWIGTEQEKFLRPSTIFGTKFESYLNQRITAKKTAKPTGFSNLQQRDYDFDDLEKRLLESQEID